MFDCCRGNRDGYQQIGLNGQRFGVRHFQCLLAFFGLAVAYAMRVNFSVAIVAMTNQNSTDPNWPAYDWDETTKSWLLSSFFWGYVMTQVPGGQIAAKYGAKYTFFSGILISSTLALLTPLVVSIGGWKALMFLRASQGLSQGVIFPSTHTFLSKWSPTEERGRLVACCYSGAQFGTVIMLSASGFIASSSFGWPAIFYASGVVGVIWAAIWYKFSASTPAEHLTISQQERNYIIASAAARRTSDAKEPVNLVTPTTPWRSIFTSVPFLVLLLCHCTNNYGFWMLLSEMPTFLHSVLGMDIQNNGPLSALPYLAMLILTGCFIALSDYLNRRGGNISLESSRKFFNTLGFWLPMLALLTLGYISDVNQSAELAILLLTVAVATNAATYLGFQVNHIDLAPNYAGTLMGITNASANVMSIVAPISVGFIVTNENDPLQWRLVFFLAAALYFIGNLLFVTLGSTSVQPWNAATPSTIGETEEEHRTDEDQNLLGDSA